MPRRRPHRGFTLVEILIVVVILGVLAAIVTPQAANAMGQTRQTAFVRAMRTFTDAAILHRAREGQWLSDSSTGQIPGNFDDYIDADQWEAPTPIGGSWDTETAPDEPVSLALGVVFEGEPDPPDAAYMAEVDAIADDGELTTGAFRQMKAQRYYFIVEW